MNTSLLLGGLFAFLAVALAVFGIYSGRKWVFPLLVKALEAYWSERWTDLEVRLQGIEADLASLPRVWQEFATDAKKAQERARWHVRRVKQELESRGLSDPEIDTLDSDIRRRDGEGGNGQGVLPLPENMEAVSQTQEDPIARALRQKWGS